MSQDKEAFLNRWSRLKREEQVKEDAPPPVEAKAEPPLAPLPPVEELTPESDFKPFMDPRVNLDTRRDALKKLFADAHFNVPDPYEAYSEDYTIEDPIPEAMLKTLNQAKKLLFDEPEKAVQAPAEESVQASAEQSEAPAQEAKDVARKQDA